MLNEIANVARRKMAMSWPETASLISDIRALVAVVPLTETTHELGLRLAERHVLSIWDSMIVAAATEAGCETLWSEDMHHGLVTDNGPRIANPFLAP